jgi:hypothetical protein
MRSSSEYEFLVRPLQSKVDFESRDLESVERSTLEGYAVLGCGPKVRMYIHSYPAISELILLLDLVPSVSKLLFLELNSKFEMSSGQGNNIMVYIFMIRRN